MKNKFDANTCKVETVIVDAVKRWNDGGGGGNTVVGKGAVFISISGTVFYLFNRILVVGKC